MLVQRAECMKEALCPSCDMSTLSKWSTFTKPLAILLNLTSVVEPVAKGTLDPCARFCRSYWS